jgi:hypothetical protein
MQYNAGFTIGCHDRQAGLLNKDLNDQYNTTEQGQELDLAIL